MKDLWNGIGIAIVLLALLVCTKGCDDPRPLIGEHGSIVDTYRGGK